MRSAQNPSAILAARDARVRAEALREAQNWLDARSYYTAAYGIGEMADEAEKGGAA